MSSSAREEILKLFRQKKEGFVSGAEISQALGVSRTAVWKQIQLLRDLGYGIEAVSSRGYQLVSTPDTLIPAEVQAELGTALVGKKVVYFEETDSTNVRAQELGKAGAEDGTVVIADHQHSGKGRLGRQWASPQGVNLYTSILLRPNMPPYFAPQLTFLSAVAVARSISELTGLDARVKWPNDVLIGGKKVAGLLNEMSAETDGIHFVVLGVGVNLNMTEAQFPPDLRYPATSLMLELGESVSRLAFSRLLYRQIDELYTLYMAQGFDPVINAWNELFDLVGKEVTVGYQDRVERGMVQGLDPDGALLLELPDGDIHKVLAGDVKPVSI